jgi:hypothetical protein
MKPSMAVWTNGYGIFDSIGPTMSQLDNVMVLKIWPSRAPKWRRKTAQLTPTTSLP